VKDPKKINDQSTFRVFLKVQFWTRKYHTRHPLSYLGNMIESVQDLERDGDLYPYFNNDSVVLITYQCSILKIWIIGTKSNGTFKRVAE